MHIKSLQSVTALAALALAAACADSPTAPTPTPLAARADKATDAGGSALFFNGVDANASTTLGSIVTTQIDDMEYAATVRYDGPNAATAWGDDHQIIVYNGHGAVSGWGILILGSGQGFADGTVSILAGGITVAPTSLVLPRGQWVDVSAVRSGGVVTVRVDDRTESVGAIPVHPVGADWAAIERTSVGGDGLFDEPSGMFHGAIKDVSLRTGNTWIERWRFAGHGNTSTGINGTVLRLGTASWIQGNS